MYLEPGGEQIEMSVFNLPLDPSQLRINQTVAISIHFMHLCKSTWSLLPISIVLQEHSILEQKYTQSTLFNKT